MFAKNSQDHNDEHTSDTESETTHETQTSKKDQSAARPHVEDAHLR